MQINSTAIIVFGAGGMYDWDPLYHSSQHTGLQTCSAMERCFQRSQLNDRN